MKKMKISKKQLAAAAFAAFFLIMAVCTGISRIAASILVPKVTTESVQEGKLSVVIQGKGIVETRMESLISLEKGLRVEKILSAGTVVKKGDVLLQYDKAYLQESVDKKRAEIQKLELAVQQARITGQPPARAAATDGAARDVQLSEENYARAEEGYSMAATNYDEGILLLQQTLEREKQAAEEEKMGAMKQAQELEQAGKQRRQSCCAGRQKKQRSRGSHRHRRYMTDLYKNWRSKNSRRWQICRCRNLHGIRRTMPMKAPRSRMPWQLQMIKRRQRQAVIRSSLSRWI